jgi:hypothetical protein
MASIRKGYRPTGADDIGSPRHTGLDPGKESESSMEPATISIVWIAVIAVVVLFFGWVALGRLLRRKTDEMK